MIQNLETHRIEVITILLALLILSFIINSQNELMSSMVTQDARRNSWYVIIYKSIQ